MLIVAETCGREKRKYIQLYTFLRHKITHKLYYLQLHTCKGHYQLIVVKVQSCKVLFRESQPSPFLSSGDFQGKNAANCNVQQNTLTQAIKPIYKIEISSYLVKIIWFSQQMDIQLFKQLYLIRYIFFLPVSSIRPFLF